MTSDQRIIQMQASVEQLHEKMEQLTLLLIGDGDAAKPSIVLRVDRLERTEKTRAKVVWTAASAAIVACVSTMMRHFRVSN